VIEAGVAAHRIEDQLRHPMHAVRPSGEKFRSGQHQPCAAEEDLASLVAHGPGKDLVNPIARGFIQQGRALKQVEDHDGRPPRAGAGPFQWLRMPSVHAASLSRLP
jgi:hypothetical protein